MDQTIELLRAWGCDTEGAIARLNGDEDAYLEKLKAAAEDPAWRELRNAMEDRRAEEALGAAEHLHACMEELGLTLPQQVAEGLVQGLRGGKTRPCEAQAEALRELRGWLRSLVEPPEED